jgi:formate dehydrogenase subunit gamma
MSDAVRPTASDRDRGATILRYPSPVRINHWLGAVAFFCAALSGLSLFHPALFWLSSLFGGGPWTRILHPFLGLLMLILFVLLALQVHSGESMQPRDWAWLRQFRDVVNNREERLPEVGRYNAGQKLVFYSIIVCLSVLVLSGIPIWRVYFSAYFPISLQRLGAFAHALFAFILITTIIVHIYAAIWVKGSVRAMTRGTVTPGWAWKHHRAWYRELITDAARSRSRTD